MLVGITCIRVFREVPNYASISCDTNKHTSMSMHGDSQETRGVLRGTRGEGECAGGVGGFHALGGWGRRVRSDLSSSFRA